jgi:hypothetical protein
MDPDPTRSTTAPVTPFGEITAETKMFGAMTGRSSAVAYALERSARNATCSAMAIRIASSSSLAPLEPARSRMARSRFGQSWRRTASAMTSDLPPPVKEMARSTSKRS